MKKVMLTTIALTIMLGHAFLAGADTISDRITVTVKGAGPDVVLIPGLTCSSAVWDATVKQLEGHYRLHLVQVAGFAGTPAGGNATGPVLQPTVDAIDAYIKANKLGAPAVVGHSVGGLMGMMLALQHPEDTGKLMIVDSLPFFCVLFGAKDAAAAQPQAAAMRDQVLNETPDAYAEGEKQFLSQLVKSPAGLAAATKWAIASDKAVVARALYDDMTTDLRPQLHELKTPVTMLYPFDASMGSPAAVDDVYRANFAALPHKTLVRIDDSRHFIMFDQPAAFAAQVDKFLGAAKTE